MPSTRKALCKRACKTGLPTLFTHLWGKTDGPFPSVLGDGGSQPLEHSCRRLQGLIQH